MDWGKIEECFFSTGHQKKTQAASPTTGETDDDPTQSSRFFDSELIIPHNIQYATQHSRVIIPISKLLIDVNSYSISYKYKI